MLLVRIAPHCDHYHGVDVSSSAIGFVESEVTRQGLRNVTLMRAAAHELTGLEAGSFDVVIVNSVIQYFPDAEYLAAAIKRVCPFVRDGGTVFLGDVRSLPLNEAFHASVELKRAPIDLSSHELRRRIRLRLERENELVVDPRFFRVLRHHLPVIRRVGVVLKRGRHANEMNCFRYDVLLGIGGSSAPATPEQIVCGNDMTLSRIRERLRPGEELVLAGITNSRVVRAVRAVELLASDQCPETAGEIQLQLSTDLDGGVDPEELWALDVPHEIELSWSDHGADRFDAIFRDRAAAALAGEAPVLLPLPTSDWNQYTTRPAAQTLGASLAVELKEMMRDKLPDYMVPTTIVVMDALPRTPNGKIDQKALPAPGREAPVNAAEYTAPQTELETAISAVWQELLNLKRVGTHDNFFDLGANSLIMVQASSRLRAVLRKELSLIDLFRYPTVCALAARLSQSRDDQSALRQSQERGRSRVDALQRRRTGPRAGPAYTPNR
jgi:SAM-dependent methyltransferase